MFCFIVFLLLVSVSMVKLGFWWTAAIVVGLFIFFVYLGRRERRGQGKSSQQAASDVLDTMRGRNRL